MEHTRDRSSLAVTVNVNHRAGSNEKRLVILYCKQKNVLIVPNKASSPLPLLWLKDLKGRYYYVNEAFLELGGFKSAEEVIGKTEGELRSERSFFGEEDVSDKTESGFHSERELKIYRNDYESFSWFRVIETPMFDECGEVTSISGVAYDVTEQKRLELEYDQLKDRYDTIFSNQECGLIIVDRKERIVSTNRAAEMIFCAQASEIVGRHFREFVTESHYNELIRARATLRKGKKSYLELRVELADKKKKDIRLLLIPQLEKNNGYIETVAVVNDITDQKRVEEEIIMLASATRNANDCISITDMQDRIIYANPAFMKTYGYDASEVLGKSIKMFRSPNNDPRKMADIVQKTLQGGWKGEVLNRKKDGTEFTISTSTSVLRNDQGNPIAMIGIARDISFEKQFQKELLKIEKLESVNIMAGGIAHDFNNLLTSILGYISLAGIDVADPEKVKNRLSEAERVCCRAKDLTHQLLTFSKGEVSEKSIISLLDVIVESANFSLAGTKAECSIDLADDLHTVEADEGQISQVINNIVLNAVQASADPVRVTIKAKNIVIDQRTNLPLAPGKYVQISISDWGKGMTEEEQLKIFDPFFTTKKTGSGLGLSTCFNILKNHNGFITSESELSKGTTFHLFLPASNAELTKEEIASVFNEPQGGKRVLIVDLDQDVGAITASMVKAFGYGVDVITDRSEMIGKEGHLVSVSEPAQETYSMVIIDASVLEFDHLNTYLTELLTSEKRVFKVISGCAKEEVLLNDYSEYRFDRVLSKPFRTDDIIRLLVGCDELLLETT